MLDNKSRPQDWQWLAAAAMQALDWALHWYPTWQAVAASWVGSGQAAGPGGLGGWQTPPSGVVLAGGCLAVSALGGGGKTTFWSDLDMASCSLTLHSVDYGGEGAGERGAAGGLGRGVAMAGKT